MSQNLKPSADFGRCRRRPAARDRKPGCGTAPASKNRTGRAPVLWSRSKARLLIVARGVARRAWRESARIRVPLPCISVTVARIRRVDGTGFISVIAVAAVVAAVTPVVGIAPVIAAGGGADRETRAEADRRGGVTPACGSTRRRHRDRQSEAES